MKRCRAVGLRAGVLIVQSADFESRWPFAARNGCCGQRKEIPHKFAGGWFLMLLPSSSWKMEPSFQKILQEICRCRFFWCYLGFAADAQCALLNQEGLGLNNLKTCVREYMNGV